jgi:imidazolonepropionase-like amidohydrolase
LDILNLIIMKHACSFAVLIVVSAVAQPVPNPPAEEGSFVLYKFAKAIGKETWKIAYRSGQLTLTSDFLFTDRGASVPLSTTFLAKTSLEPISLNLDGRSSRAAELRDKFVLDTEGHRVAVFRNNKTTYYPASDLTFLMDGYSPVAMQQMLMRFWLAHGRPAQIPTPPGGVLHIEPTADLTVTVDNTPVTLHGYVITGLIWGAETLWLDDRQQLVCLVSTDAEFDHFEAVRDTFEPALATFIQKAAQNNLDALAKLAASAQQLKVKRLAVTNVTLIDGAGGPALNGANVFIEDGVITRIDLSSRPDTKSYEKFDGSGKFLIPGLWDMHAHYEQVEWGPIYLAAGVTTVRDCGNEFDFITTVRNELRSGKGIGPRLLIAGVVDGSGPTSLGAIVADTPEEAIAVVRRYKAAGASQIKIYGSMKPALVPVITAEAHGLGMTVTGHVPKGMTTAEAVEAGFDGINHIEYPAHDLLHMPDVWLDAEGGKPVPPADFTNPDARKLIALFQQHHTVFDDTAALSELGSRPDSVPLATLEPGSTHVAPQLVESVNTPGVSAKNAARATEVYRSLVATISELHKDGLVFVAGTDQAIPGHSLHRELEIYVQAGFTPMEALQAATIVPARVMGLDKELGTIEVGKRADMVVLDADPLEDIRNSRRIAKTIAGGAIYDPAPLWQSVGFLP